jgi:hypothetical protein
VPLEGELDRAQGGAAGGGDVAVGVFFDERDGAAHGGGVGVMAVFEFTVRLASRLVKDGLSYPVV